MCVGSLLVTQLQEPEAAKSLSLNGFLGRGGGLSGRQGGREGVGEREREERIHGTSLFFLLNTYQLVASEMPIDSRGKPRD